MLKSIQIGEDLTFGEPWRLTEKSLSAVIPILRRNPAERSYVLIQEVQDKVIIEDTGSIGRARVKNQTGKNVFIRKGILLKGLTQARGVTVGTVILPEMSKELEIQCVHASRGIRAGARLVEAGIAPRRVEKSFLRRASQHDTWTAVGADSHARYSMAALPTGFGRVSDDLVGALEQTTRFKDEIEEALKKIPADRMDQVGVAILDIRGVMGVEFFDHPDSWRAFSISIIRNYADVLTQETPSDLYEIKMDKVASAVLAFLQKLAEAKETVVAEVEGSKTYALDGEVAVGEYTTISEKMIHLIGARKEKEDLRPQQPPIRWPGTLPTRPSYRHQAPQWTTTAAPQTPQLTPEHLFQHKGGYQLLMSLQEPKTWKRLAEDIPLSTRTLSKRVSEAQNLGLINHKPRPENGVQRQGRPARMTYQLTSEGAEVLKKAKSFMRT